MYYELRKYLMPNYLIYRYLSNRCQALTTTAYPADQIWPQMIHQFKVNVCQAI